MVTTATVSASEAGSLIVTTTADVVANDGETSLREAVAFANSDPDQSEALFEPAEDKIYRHPTFYDIPDEVGHM